MRVYDFNPFVSLLKKDMKQAGYRLLFYDEKRNVGIAADRWNRRYYVVGERDAYSLFRLRPPHTPRAIDLIRADFDIPAEQEDAITEGGPDDVLYSRKERLVSESQLYREELSLKLLKHGYRLVFFEPYRYGIGFVTVARGKKAYYMRSIGLQKYGFFRIRPPHRLSDLVRACRKWGHLQKDQEERLTAEGPDLIYDALSESLISSRSTLT